ncbi:MAG TPA: LuxR C-terminal-related transcriptional regulator, partial [Iamia sp.]|nr:LuxR C-terminal-related transcriptional regulator [Iamia sp.]
LRRRRLFLTTIDDGVGDTVRFHPLFRELLENELRWRDPARRIDLHRRAAELWRARGDLTSAYHHLVTIDDLAAAGDLVLPVAVHLVDHGGVTALAEHMRRLPEDMHVGDASRAFDLAQAWALAGGQEEAIHWSAFAEHLVAANGSSVPLRTHATAALIDLLKGSVVTAWDHVARFDRCDAGAGPIEWQLPAVAARAALLTGRTAEARTWIDRAAVLGGHQEAPTLERVVVPALTAWWELEDGDLARARGDADDVVDVVERIGLRPHLGAFDALVVAVRCRIGAGQLGEADELLERVRADAGQLRWTLPRVQAGLLIAEVARLRTGAAAALAALEELRHSVRPRPPAPLEGWLGAAEAAALITCARFADARACIERLDDAPRSRLLRARLAVRSRSREPVEPLLRDRARWSTPACLEGEVLAALADGRRDGAEGALRAALHAGAETGWVSPFLEVADLVQARLGARRVEQLHPALAVALRARSTPRDRSVSELLEPLTPRELTLLELLPTHLSYAEIGDRLFLSVNTIKSNLKAIYRKLDVTSRTDAVETAWRLGLLEPLTPGGGPSAAGTRPRR